MKPLNIQDYASGFENVQEAEARRAMEEWRHFWSGLMLAAFIGACWLAAATMLAWMFLAAYGS